MDRFRPRHPKWVLSTVPVAVVLVVLLASSGLLLACERDSTTTMAGSGDAKKVTFTTQDGIELAGYLFGTGAAGVVLAHMYPTDQTSWYAAANRLAEEGYLVLTFDFRGYGDSAGNKQFEYLDRDVFAAVQHIAEAGASNVVIVGASMGGTASLAAAEELFAGQLSSADIPAVKTTVAGVATLSAPVSFKGLSAERSVAKIYCPLLFVAAKDDVGADGATELEELSGNSGDLEIVAGEDHGTDLLQGSEADEVWDLLLDFLSKNLPRSSQPS